MAKKASTTRTSNAFEGAPAGGAITVVFAIDGYHCCTPSGNLSRLIRGLHRQNGLSTRGRSPRARTGQYIGLALPAEWCRGIAEDLPGSAAVHGAIEAAYY